MCTLLLLFASALIYSAYLLIKKIKNKAYTSNHETPHHLQLQIMRTPNKPLVLVTRATLENTNNQQPRLLD